MENKHEEIEILDFDSTPSLEETTEMLDFENDVKVAKEIDEMLDFFDFKPVSNNEELTKLLEKKDDNQQKIEIDASEEKIDEYVPSIKDFNIKSAKTRKIVKKAMLYVIIAMLLGFEFFITKTGEVLNDLRVYASDIQPIIIEENEKYGFIDYTGNKIVNPKYSYAGEFIDGYAIVKNSSNLPLIIDKGGKEVAPTGTYFTLYRTGEDIIASKVTKKGLKYGVLSSGLDKKVDFKYDMITPVDGAYTFTLGNTVGLINKEGKKIFEYKLTDKDDKSIYVTSSNVLDNVNDRYAVVTINSSSMIVNLKDGTVVTNPTLETISVNDNNVFYRTDKNGNITYFYVYNNSVVMETIDSKEISVDSIDAGVIKVTNNNYSKSYVSVKTKEKVNKNLNDNNVYSGQNVFMYKKYDYKLYKEVIVMVKNGEEYKVLTDDITIEKPFKNGIAIVKFTDGTYGYLNEEGNFISDNKFIEVTEFDSYGEAIAKTNDGYGVINKDGKVVLDFKYKEIKMVNDVIKKKTSFEDNVFYAAKEDTRYAIYNSDGKRANKTYYNDIVFDEKYPVFKASTDKYDFIITSDGLGKITLASFNKEYSVYENYIVVDNNYYNYNGKLIYESNNRK